VSVGQPQAGQNPYSLPYGSTNYMAPPTTPIQNNRPLGAPEQPVRYGTTGSPVITGSDGTPFQMGASGPVARVEIKTEPRVFSQDLKKDFPAGEDRDLSLIIQGPFVWRQWDIAEEQIDRFLADHEAAAAKGGSTYSAAEGRARFYLGQSRYFRKDYRGALDEFMKIRGRYPSEVESWVQSTLALIASSKS
jgi:hypothetical protein